MTLCIIIAEVWGREVFSQYIDDISMGKSGLENLVILVITNFFALAQENGSKIRRRVK